MNTIEESKLVYDKITGDEEDNEIYNEINNNDENFIKEQTNNIIDQFKGDICKNDEECDLCSFLNALCPNLFSNTDNPQLLKPFFDVSPYNSEILLKQEERKDKSEITILWDDYPDFDPNGPSYVNISILRAIQEFEEKMNSKSQIRLNEIPLVVYVNFTSEDGKGIISHSHILIMINGTNGKEVYTLGLGQNKNTNTITIRSPDFNPFLKVDNERTDLKDKFTCRPYNNKEKKYSGIYIIKGVEPLTTDHYNNLHNFLENKIKGLSLIEVDKKDVRGQKKRVRESIWSIQTTIPYNMLNLFKGENCASFSQMMSHKENKGFYSLKNTICGINNPSSSIHRERSKLLDFINNVKSVSMLGENDEAENNAVEYLINMYNKFEPYKRGGRRTKKRRRRKSNRRNRIGRKKCSKKR
jgi:hypothetical protein